MKYIYSQSEGAGILGNGLIKRWVGCLLGVVVFVSAAGSVALAQNGAMTQQQYLQWMANVCGDRLPASASGQDFINWARGKGMNPSGGWQLNAKLTKEVMAQTIVQLLNLAPRKGNFDAARILEQQGIILTSNNGYVGVKNLAAFVDTGFAKTIRGNAYGLDNPRNPHVDDDDDDVLTPTKPGGGSGGYGPPGQVGVFPGKGHGYGRGNHF
jgi:hypothetical protein